MTGCSTLDAALSQLLVEHPAIGELVKLRYFGGLTTEQAARALKISSRTAKRHWVFAKAWLRRKIDRDGLQDGLNVREPRVFGRFSDFPCPLFPQSVALPIS